MSRRGQFSLDQNLGFPLGEPRLQAFLEKSKLDVLSTANLQQLADGLVTGQPTFSYVPASVLHALAGRTDAYSPALIAHYRATRAATDSSILVVPRESDAQSIADLRGKRLGIINRYCTSSYFAPAILLSEQGLALRSFFSKIVEVAAWQGQVDALLAGTVDATMVLSDVWAQTATNALQARIIGSMADIPAPVILARRGIDPALQSAFADIVLSLGSQAGPEVLFSGFEPYRPGFLDDYLRRARQAFG